MAEIIDIFKAQLVRNNPSQQWGIRLAGGIDVAEPLHISAVISGGLAEKVGLQVNDKVTEMDNMTTSHMTFHQAQELLDMQRDSLFLTVERSARNNQRLQHPYDQSCDHEQQQHYYSTTVPARDSYNAEQYFDFQTVQARPFEGPVSRTQQFSTNRLPPNHDVASHGNNPFDSHSSTTYYTTTDSSSNTSLPQSRTFKLLRSVMENEGPPAGVAGLPPPRSASIEQIRRERQQKQASPRVKVLMPQQYNSPMGMYSAENVVDTFKVQAQTALNSIERKQMEQEGIHSSYNSYNLQ